MSEEKKDREHYSNRHQYKAGVKELPAERYLNSVNRACDKWLRQNPDTIEKIKQKNGFNGY